MTESKSATATDWVDPDDAPELTDKWFDQAELKVGDKVVRRGRPPGSNKVAINIRLDRDIVDRFRATGAGWQTRINEALRRTRV